MGTGKYTKKTEDLIAIDESSIFPEAIDFLDTFLVLRLATTEFYISSYHAASGINKVV